MLDLLTQLNFPMEASSSWELLHGEYQALDSRRGYDNDEIKSSMLCMLYQYNKIYS